jgi:hypothetical protein
LVRTDFNGLRVGGSVAVISYLPQEVSGARYWEFDEDELYAVVEDLMRNSAKRSRSTQIEAELSGTM